MSRAGLVLFECAECERLTTAVPIRDEHTDRLWCSQPCRDAAEEAHWLRRWTAS